MSVAVAWLVALVLLGVSLVQNGGQLVYPLDDTYIHMALAKNVSLHGVWGVTRYAFTSSSSSPLWTLLLASVYAALGPSEVVPLVLNLLLGALVLTVFYVLLRNHVADQPYVLTALLVAALVTPLPTLMLSGMEHVLQIAVGLVFAYQSARAICRPQAAVKPRDVWSLLVLAPLAAATRYEGLFLIAAVWLILLWRGRIVSAFALLASGLLPVAIYGEISVANGWSWLPNSLLIKGNVPSLTSLQDVGAFLSYSLYRFRALILAPHVLLVLLSSPVLFVSRMKRGSLVWEERQVMLVVVTLATVQQVVFANLGWLLRYEAYLMALWLFTTASVLPEYLPIRLSRRSVPRYVTTLLVVSLVLGTLLARALLGLAVTPQAMHDRYLEHIQVARFVGTYYDEAVVVLSDLGAITFYTDARILDIGGLGSMQPVALSRGTGHYTKGDVLEWARREGATIAVLQDQLGSVRPLIPDEWARVGEWELPRNVISGDTRIGFYAVDARERIRLASNLRQFTSQLPRALVASVEQTE